MQAYKSQLAREVLANSNPKDVRRAIENAVSSRAIEARSFFVSKTKDGEKRYQVKVLLEA